MEYDDNNVFQKILKGDLPAKIIYEDRYSLAFEDISPAAKIHVLVIPKLKFISFSDFAQKAPDEIKLGFMNSINQVIEKLKIKEKGYRLITNHGKYGYQTVFHFHVHILAGEQFTNLTSE